MYKTGGNGGLARAEEGTAGVAVENRREKDMRKEGLVWMKWDGGLINITFEKAGASMHRTIG